MNLILEKWTYLYMDGCSFILEDLQMVSYTKQMILMQKITDKKGQKYYLFTIKDREMRDKVRRAVKIRRIFWCVNKCTIFKEENIMNEEIKKAKKLLIENGYVVKKLTRSMELDANKCVEMEEHGQSKDCCGCTCSVCLMQ